MKTGGETGQTEIKLVRKKHCSSRAYCERKTSRNKEKQIWEETPNNWQRLLVTSALISRLNVLVCKKATNRNLLSVVGSVLCDQGNGHDHLHDHIVLSC